MVFDTIRGIITDHVDIDKHLINMDSCMKKDLGADSLDMLDILMDIEEIYDIDIPDKNLGTIVGEYVRYIEAQTGQIQKSA